MMMRTVLRLTLVLALAPCALAGREVDEVRDASPDGEVSIELLAGTVEVVGWDRKEVRVTGTLGDDVERLDIDVEEDEIAIEVVLPRGKRSIRDGGADLLIRVPRASRVFAESVSAGFSFEELRGEVEAESVSGGLEIRGAPRELRAATVSGRIDVRSDEPLREGRFDSVSGAIRFRAPLDPRGDFGFDTVSGSIELRLPAGTSAEFDVETFSGKIENELGPPAERVSEYAPGRSLRFSLGGGGADVEIQSFSGRIEILAD